MPLPFEFEGKGVVLLKNQQQQYEEEDQEATFVVPYANPLVHFQNFVINNKKTKYNNEPTSVLENITTSPSPPASISTTLSSSHGGAAESAGLASLSYSTNKWLPENQDSENLPENQDFENPLEIQEIATENLKCVGMEDWENGDSGQDQTMLRWIMGDVEDPSIGLNKILHSTAVTGTVTGVSSSDFEFNGGFGVVDQGFIGNLSNPQLSPVPMMFQTHRQNQIFSPLNDTQMLPFDIKPNLFNLQTQRYNSGNIEYNPQKNKKLAPINHQQGIIDQLFKAAELIQSGNNPILAQEILARLNHQLSPIGKPFERASFYFKEALNLLTHSVLNNINPQITPTCSPFSLIFKISAYKSFSEISPFVQFANFTCNQALLESLNGFDRIHIIDFDIGYGGQWASLMQELALRNNGVSSLKITAFASPLTHDQLELGLTRENLIHFASEINVGFEFEIVNIDVLANSSWSLPFNLSDNNEAIAVNLPIHVLSNHQTQIPSVLRFVKSLNPKIVVSVDRGCDRTDLPFSNHMIHALQSYSNLLQSLDAVNMNLDSSQKIERFLIQPAIEKIVLGRFLFPEKTQHWQNLFFSAGFSPLLFSNFTESQAECLVKRTPVHEFHVEKRQSLLVLCWQRRELVSASAWRC